MPAHGQVTFSPTRLPRDDHAAKDRSLLTDGKRFPLTLHFEKAGDVTVEVAVQKQPPEGTSAHQH